MLESTFHEDWDKIGSNRAKKGQLLLKSTIFSKLAGCQWVNRPKKQSRFQTLLISSDSFLNVLLQPDLVNKLMWIS